MHACGHDTQTSALLGAAGALKKLAEDNELEGDIILLFQPNEERTDPKRKSGAVQMIKALEKMGLRDKINAFFALHVYSEMERGKILLPKDMLCGSSSSFKLKLEAPGGHASESWKLPNIEKLLAHIETRLDEKFGFKGPQTEQPKIILEPGLHKTDSQAVNILSEKGEVSWTLRILLPGIEFKPTRTNIIQELKKIILDEVGPWQEKGAKWSVDYNPGTRPVAFRDPKLVELSEEVAKDILGEKMEIDRKPILGGEDFSYYPEPFSKGMTPKKTIPGVMILVGGANPEKGIPLVGHHQPNFKIDEESIIDMAKIYAEFSRRYLEQK
jgi:amidohydrolase